MAINKASVSDSNGFWRIEQTSDPDYFTKIDGVGYIPRDIYKYVASNPCGDLPRYSVHIVIQHLLIFVTFILLAATGLPILFSDVFWAPYAIALFGGIDMARLIHRSAAMVMILTALYHLATIIGGTIHKLATGKFDYKRTQLPRWKDFVDLIEDLKYFLGVNRYRPKMEKFMYKQKLHYLGVLYGSSVLIIAGSTLLFPDTMSQLFPDTIGKIIPSGVTGGSSVSTFFQDLARLMHADEAVMALVLLAFWHWSNVHLVPGRFPSQWTFLTGKITREHQIEEHFLEYLNNLKEIPQEREYMRNLLKELSIDASMGDATCATEDLRPQQGE